MDWVTVFSGSFALIGFAMLVAAARIFARRRRFVQNSAIALGTIVALTERKEGVDSTYFPKVKFQTPPGREVVFQSEMGSDPAIGQIGDTIAVRYQLDQPHKAEINSFLSLWGVTLVFAVLGSAFFFVGLAIIFGVIRL
jgi:hypothetical protein